MRELNITKSQLQAMLGEMAKTQLVAGPIQNGKTVDFSQVMDVSSLIMDDVVAYQSPKKFLFPPCEKLMAFNSKTGEAEVDSPEKPAVLFGVKPCDLRAFQVLHEIFTTGPFQDPFFQARWDNTAIIGVDCQEQKPGCFCQLLQVSMAYSQNCDLFLADKGEHYAVLFVSHKGKERFVPFFPELQHLENSGFHEKCFDQTLSLPDQADAVFDTIDWGKITEICQGCGLCTFVCPTCHCFDFKDVAQGDTASRYRRWDSCMFPKFTLHASGHNPRNHKMQRYRQRVLHKYVYVKQNVGLAACTGCGRCVRGCPAGMNIQTIVQGIMEELLS